MKTSGKTKTKTNRLHSLKPARDSLPLTILARGNGYSCHLSGSILPSLATVTSTMPPGGTSLKRLTISC